MTKTRRRGDDLHAPTTRHPRTRVRAGLVPGHGVPTTILFRMGPPCKYRSPEQPHYKLNFICRSRHRAQGGARRSKGGRVRNHRVKAVYSSTATFLRQGDVSAGLSPSRTAPRRRRARITFAAGLDRDGTIQASACFGLSRIFLLATGILFKKYSSSTALGVSMHCVCVLSCQSACLPACLSL